MKPAYPPRVPFAYYERLSPREKAVYRRSDEVPAVRLYEPSSLGSLVEMLRSALADGSAEDVEAAAQPLCDALTRRLGVPPVALTVHEARPRWPGAELHGLYTQPEGTRPQIHVWMRTARHRRPVAFRTFLRTLLHELCHHLDMELLELPISFHTMGFFKRETSLFHQLVPAARLGRKDH